MEDEVLASVGDRNLAPACFRGRAGWTGVMRHLVVYTLPTPSHTSKTLYLNKEIYTHLYIALTSWPSKMAAVMG